MQHNFVKHEFNDMEARRPYPLDTNGLPISPDGIGECYEVCLRGAKQTNTHHLTWPRASYRGKPERAYRETACMKVAACVCKHADVHATYLPPQPPDVHTMYDVVQGDIQPQVAEVFIRPRNDANLEAMT